MATLARSSVKTGYKARGKAAVEGKPQFKGYRKDLNVPVYLYSIGDVDFTLKIEPGKEAGSALCHYTAKGFKSNLVMKFNPETAAQMSSDKGEFKNGTLTLNSSDAASFTITIKAE